MGLPSLKSEFGQQKDLDFEVLLSQDFINKHMPEVKPPGLTIEEDGTFSIAVNLATLLKVRQSEIEWITGRTIFMTF